MLWSDGPAAVKVRVEVGAGRARLIRLDGRETAVRVTRGSVDVTLPAALAWRPGAARLAEPVILVVRDEDESGRAR